MPQVVAKCPLVHQARIIAAKDDDCCGKAVTAVVVRRREALGQASGLDIIACVRRHRAAYKVPKIVEFIDHLPVRARAS